ncbi:MAG: signal peptide peptidase SppA [Proteobacteria bacterium]|nr:signal peptide peptidase SppA [Pseudomonadota bacterium]
MNLESDLMVDRRRLRRQLTFWRVLAIVVALAGVVALGLVWSGAAPNRARPHVARITIDGLITGKQETLDLLERAANPAVKAVVLRINSGGGTTAGSETLYNEVRRLAEKKPVVAVIDTVGASGAYMTALGAHRILANGSALVGSIGVVAQVPNVTKLLDTLGVKVESVRSTPLKALPNGVEVTPPEARAALEATVKDTYVWFKALVGERRKLEGAALDTVADARVFTGRQALGLKLVDALGDERAALAWLEAEKGLSKGLPVLAYKPPQGNRLPTISSLAKAMTLIGLPESIVQALSGQLGEAPRLDGLVSLWHASGE